MSSSSQMLSCEAPVATDPSNSPSSKKKGGSAGVGKGCNTGAGGGHKVFAVSTIMGRSL
eukprot:CAMPEP_0172673116 /NCGR_PEP_ID=MMETSP1074-20121228/11952_1 /TAXON_ID=2916 /ORGANISM="Ceratium fusus, Strain PA161109" /LENGTH=58 /DNA_ID=CAMNT_0013490381 /DNA_START=186 /DNA_END=362 /DNA_ORIENTATION=-